MNILIIIPARYGSTRLPGKPLLDLGGQPVIEHVYLRASEARLAAQVLVATDDERIASAVRAFGGEAVMTSPAHQTGMDRCAEAASFFPQADLIINIQGDEPFIEPRAIETLALGIKERFAIATLCCPLSPDQLTIPSVVKVEVDGEGRAVDFWRLPKNGRPPARGLFRHLGCYAYRRHALLAAASWPRHEREIALALEQHRPLAGGLPIQAIGFPAGGPAIDTAEDLERARLWWNKLPKQPKPDLFDSKSINPSMIGEAGRRLDVGDDHEP